MSIFKKDPWTKLGEKDFGKLVTSLLEYQQLERIIGPLYAQGSLKAMWNKLSMGGTHAQYNDRSVYQGMLVGMLKHEINCVLSAHYHIGSLQVKARTRAFSNQFRADTMAPADYGARTTDSNVEKAASYIIFTSTSLKKTADSVSAPVTRTAIQQALQNAAQYDPRSQATLRDLHRRLVDQTALRPTRCMDKSAPYPSTGGAAFLLEKTFSFAKGIPLPASGSADWFDLACFLLGAVIRSHGFTDGNGRVGRAAFATAMLKGGGNFVALKVEAEKSIHGLDNVS